MRNIYWIAVKPLLISVVVIMMCMCSSSTRFSKKDVVGVWKSQEGAQLCFTPQGTLIVKGILDLRKYKTYTIQSGSIIFQDNDGERTFTKFEKISDDLMVYDEKIIFYKIR